MSTYKNKMMVTEKYDVRIVIIDDKAKRTSDGNIQPYHLHFPETTEEAEKRKAAEEHESMLNELRQIQEGLQGE